MLLFSKSFVNDFGEPKPEKMTFRIVYTLLVASFAVVRSFNLTVLHVNDIHSRFRETDVFGGTSKEQVEGT